MKKFQFSLQPVKDVRVLKEERLEKELAALVAQQQAWRTKLGQLLRQREEIQAWQADCRRQKILDPGLEAACLQRQMADERQKTMYQDAIRLMGEAIEAKRLELVEASKEKKAVEMLEEAQRKEYLLEVSREEQAFLDELARHQFLDHGGAQA